MTDDVSLLRMIGRIYESATDPGTLGALASDLSHDFGCNMSLLYILQNPRGRSTDLLLSATATFDDALHAAYTGYYRQRDVWALRIASRGRHGVLHGLELIDRSTLERSEIYADWYRKADVFHAIVGLFPVAGDVGIVTMSRPSRAREFDDRDTTRLNLLMPHLQRAVQIQQRLSIAEQQCALSFEMLEKIGLGIMIVTQDCRVLFANALARQVLQAPDGLTTAQGRLRARHLAQSARLEKLVRDAALTSIGQDTSPGGFIALRRPEDRPLPVLITPYRAPAGADGHRYGAALLMFSDPRAQATAPETVIAQMLGVSPAEARLVSAVVSGQTMAEYAERIGITMNTVKTQMRQIFYKTGYNRQTDIIRAVLTNPLTKLANGEHAAPDRREAAE